MTGVQVRDADGADKLRVRPDEARVRADIDKRAAGSQHASDLAHDGREVVHVRVSPHRNNRVEALVVERQCGRVRRDSLDAAVTGALKEILGDVGADDLPTALGERGAVGAGSAPNVEQPSVCVTEKSEGRLARRPVVGKLAVVPLGEPVVASRRHGDDRSFADYGYCSPRQGVVSDGGRPRTR